MSNIAVILDSNFEDAEYSIPKERLEDAGYKLTIIGIAKGKKLIGKNNKSIAKVDDIVSGLNPDDFDGLLIPGGSSSHYLKTDEAIVSFVRAFGETNRPIACICYGPQLLINSGILKGKRLTSSTAIKGELQAVGATWLDGIVIVDKNLITSSKPEHLDKLCMTLITYLQKKNLAGFQ